MIDLIDIDAHMVCMSASDMLGGSLGCRSTATVDDEHVRWSLRKLSTVRQTHLRCLPIGTTVAATTMTWMTSA